MKVLFGQSWHADTIKGNQHHYISTNRLGEGNVLAENKHWRFAALGVLAITSATAVAACGGGAANQQQDGAREPEKRKELELHHYATASPGHRFLDGENENNNMFTKLLFQKTGIRLIADVYTSDNVKNKINVAIASGTAPDAINGSANEIAEYARSGAIQPLDDLIVKYGGKELKEWLELENGKGKIPLTINGKLYALPNIQEYDQNDMLLYMRKDWLDKLALQTPRTTDELEAVLRAFVEKDPDSNGKKDTIGLLATQNIGTAWAASVDPILGAFGGIQGYWINKGGSLAYGSIQPEMKQGLALLQKWYKDGLIDKEFAVYDEAKARQKIAANVAGAFFAPSWESGGQIQNSIKNDPDAKWIVVDIPAGPGGKKARRGSPFVNGGIGLYAKSKNGEAFIKYFSSILSDKDLYMASFLGFEGYNYVLKDGTPVTPNEVKLKPNYPKLGGNMKWPDIRIGHLIKPKDQWSLIEHQNNAVQKDLEKEARRLALNTRKQSVYNEFTGPSTPTMQSKYSTLAKQENETFVKIIMGASLDEFDKFIENFRKLGGDDIAKEVNDWYKTVNK